MCKIRSLLRKLADLFGSICFGFHMTWKSAPLLTACMLTAYLVGNALPIISAYALKEVVNGILSASGVFVVWFAVFLCAVIGEKATDEIGSLVFRLLEKKVYHAVDNLLIDKILMCDLSFFDNAKEYDMLKLVQENQHVIGNIVWRGVFAIANVLSLITTLTIFVAFSPMLALAVLLCVLPAIVLNKRYHDFIWEYDWNKSNDYRRMYYYGDVLKDREYAQEQRLYRTAGYFTEKYFAMWRSWYRRKKECGIRHNIKLFGANLVQTAGIAVVFVYALFAYAAGKIAVGDIQYLVNLGEQVKNQMQWMFDSAIGLGQNSREISVIRQFLAWKPQIQNQGDRIPGRLPEIVFQNVTFRYPNTEQNVLENCSFTIKSGEKVAFVGLNGAGKSTIVKLLLRFYDPVDGEILIDGVHVKEYELRALRRVFGAQLQNYVTYALTVEENLTLGDEGRLDEEKLQRALAFSGADAMVSGFEKGTQTPVTRLLDEAGEELSGGQKQKLALSRAYYRDADILILDEPSASLDPEAEHEIFSKLISLWKDRGAILISHRLSNVTLCDRIIVLDGCRIVEQGSHRELMALDGKYARMFRLQAEKYICGHSQASRCTTA